MRQTPMIGAMNDTPNNNDPPDRPDKPSARIIAFPTAEERARDKKAKAEQEAREAVWRAQYLKERKAERLARTRAEKPAFFTFGNIPLFTRILVALFLLVHLGLLLTPDQMRAVLYDQFGFTPALYTQALFHEQPLPWTAFVAPLTHAFLHGGWMHLLFNSVMLLSLGLMFEKIYGPKQACMLFFLCTLVGAGTYMAFAPTAILPVIGASGGLSGYFSVALLLMQEQKTGRRTNFKNFTKSGPYPMILLWGAVMLLPGMIMQNVAWQAHLGGYLCGLLYYGVLLGRGRG